MHPLNSGQTLHGERVRLRVWRPDDVGTIYEICQDEDIQAWSGLPSPFRVQDADEYVNVQLAEQMESGSGISFAIEDATAGADVNTVMGSVGLRGITARHGVSPATAAARWWLGAEFRGKGIVTEAALVMCRWAFTELGLDRISAFSLAGNTAARRVAQLAGFRGHATMRAAAVHRGAPVDLWHSDLVPADLGLKPGA